MTVETGGRVPRTDFLEPRPVAGGKKRKGEALHQLAPLPPAFRDPYSLHCCKECKRKTQEAVRWVQLDTLTRRCAGQLDTYACQVEREGITSNFALAKIDDVLGSGIFVNPWGGRVSSGDFIGIYSGRFTWMEQESLSSSTYLFDLIDKVNFSALSGCVLEKYHFKRSGGDRLFALHTDAEKRGNFTRFINHSADANVGYELLRVGNDIEVVYFAIREIGPGEQLLLDYGEKYWQSRNIVPVAIHPRTYLLGANGVLKGEEVPTAEAKGVTPPRVTRYSVKKLGPDNRGG